MPEIKSSRSEQVGTEQPARSAGPMVTTPAQEQTSVVPGSRVKAMLVKALILFCVAVCGAVAYRFTPLKAWLEPAGQVSVWVGQAGVWGILTFGMGMAGLILAGVPRLFFCPIAGALFGFWGGLGVSIFGTMTSYYLAFLFIRGRQSTSASPAVIHPKLAFLSRSPGVAGVVLSRIIPLPGMLVTLGLALSGVSHRAYLVGSLIGLIPEAAPLVLLGAGVLQPGIKEYMQFAVLTLFCIVVVWIAVRHVAKGAGRDGRIKPTE